MPTATRRGFADSLVDARLLHLTGSAYPAPPAGLYIALLSGHPKGDGSDVAGITEHIRVGPVTFGAPQTVSGNPDWPEKRFIQPSAAVSVTIAGTPAPGVHRDGLAWALYGQANGGQPLYVGTYAWGVLVGVATTIPASVFRVFAAEQT